MYSSLIIFLKGILMGAADVVPGVSGGTVAIVVGIYQPFINTLSKLVSKEGLSLLKKFSLKEYFFYINGPFIIPLVGGIFFSIFVLSHIVVYLYEHYKIVLWSFFFGLILASIVFLLRSIQNFSLKHFNMFILGVVLAYVLVSLDPQGQSTEAHYPMIFFSGLIALSAMMLPGISGSFLLVILGQYPIILSAVKNLDLPIIFLFSSGGLLSLIFFSKFINWILFKHFHISLALLSGFLLGSLKTIWPWKIKLPTAIKINVLPTAFTNQTGDDPYLIMAIIFSLLGFALVASVELYKRKVHNQSDDNNESIDEI